MEHKANLEHVSLQQDDLISHTQEVEQVVMATSSKVPKLAIPAELPTTNKIHHMATGFRTTQEEAAKASSDLNLQIAELRLKAQPPTLQNFESGTVEKFKQDWK